MTTIHQNFQMTAGEPRTINIQVFDEHDEPLNLTGVEDIEWHLKLRPADAESIVTKTLSDGLEILDAANGTFAVTLSGSETEALDGIYYHDAFIDQDGEPVRVISGGAFIFAYPHISLPGYEGTLVDCYYIVHNNKVYIMLNEDTDENTTYNVTVTSNIVGSDGEVMQGDHIFSFTSKYNPTYTSFQTVMMDLSLYMNNINEDYVYRYIRENSLSIRAITPRTDFNWNNPPFEFHQYIRFKTVYDMVVNAYIRSVAASGKKVRLGDLDVDNKSASADMAMILKKLEDQLQPWYDLCMGLKNRGNAKPLSFVQGSRKGGYESPYPYPRRIE